jgi:7,8-dihydropterin-6-yl-methyl-4-(beta-D-ribofuranosyl)aminobenzene 5'-phosphate synthase
MIGDDELAGAHGFSAVIETTVNGHKSTTLFDTGPDSKSIIRNIKSLKLENQIRDLGHVILSHWHSDHSGGMLSMLDLRKSLQPEKAVIIDLHPDRPIARGELPDMCLHCSSRCSLGIAPPPTFTHVIGRIPEDPSFEAIETAGGKVEQHDEGHTVADGTVFGTPRSGLKR